MKGDGCFQMPRSIQNELDLTVGGPTSYLKDIISPNISVSERSDQKDPDRIVGLMRDQVQEWHYIYWQ